jgi:NAD(P)-dependent dehydrogenase (short-subunit alcohol dehydrogenase family)
MTARGESGPERAPAEHAVPVVCDLSDITSARRAAAEIAALDLPIAGLLNNAGIMLGSVLVRDPAFSDRIVAETRALLATVR